MTRSESIIVPERHLCKIGELIDNRYTVVSLLGEGSFGHVFKVKDVSGKLLAMKVLHLWDVATEIRKPLIERFEMEFKTGKIDCENLVHSLDIGYIGGNPYIIMEFCGGGDLTKKLNDDGAQTARYAHDILLGLEALHNNGKVHRDLKPENVLIKDNGKAALTDFGIAGDRNKRMTEMNILGRPYQIFGTYAYMPPEQVNRARGMSTVLPTTDIFSFGVLLYQMVTGQLPFGKLDDQNDLVRYQKRGKMGEWDRITLCRKPNGRLWENVIDACLRPNYKQRVQSVREVMRMMPVSIGTPVIRRDTPAPRYETPQIINGYRFRVMQGVQFGQVFDLSQMTKTLGRMLLKGGRGKDNDIVIDDYQVFYTSRRHFTLEQDRDTSSFLIRDGQWNKESGWTDSSNGTFVNSSKIGAQGWYLFPGDIVTVGEVTLRYESY